MKIKINRDNIAALEAAIATIHNGREKNHVADVEDIFAAHTIAQRKAAQLLKKHLPHFRFVYSLNEQKANAYKYRYDADIFIIEWIAGEWYLVNIIRRPFFPNEKDRTAFYWDLSDEKENAIKREVADHLLKSFLS